jgi:hypothetical protein
MRAPRISEVILLWLGAPNQVRQMMKLGSTTSKEHMQTLRFQSSDDLNGEA